MTVEAKMAKLSKNLALELIPHAAHAMGFPVPPEITGIVLKAFIELLNEEKSNGERINKLLGSYYKDGIEYLTRASLAQDPNIRKDAILTAIERFTTASQVEDNLLVVKSQFYIGVCYDLLKEVQIAKHCYEKAYTSAYQRAMQLTKNGKTAKTRRVKWGDTYRDEPVYEGLFHSSHIKLIEMDEATRMKWWNMFKHLKSTDLSSESDLEVFERGFEWAYDHPEEFKAIMDEHMNKVKTSTFFADVWIFLSEKQRNEMRELRDFSNSLVPVLHAHRSTIVP